MMPTKRPVGRPKAPPTAVMRLRIPLDAYAKIMALGGDRWAKRVLIEQLEKAT